MSANTSDEPVLRIPSDTSKSTTQAPSLSDISPRDLPWDVHRGESDQISNNYRGTEFDRYSGRIDDCSQLLGFGLVPDADKGEYRLKLRSARFCRVRTCMVCSWRRSLMYKARAYKALPGVIKDFPTARYLFVTLTLKNCAVGDLKASILHLNQSFRRLAKLKHFPATGYIKTVEVTRGKCGDVHPHLHILMMVKPSFFSHGYVKKKEWCAWWKRAAKVDYTPIIDVQALKSKHSPLGLLAEVVKYQTKPNDFIFSDREWFLEYTRQIYGTKSFALGGVFKEYFREMEADETTDDLIGADEESQDGPDEGELFFGWRHREKKYRVVDN